MSRLELLATRGEWHPSPDDWAMRRLPTPTNLCLELSELGRCHRGSYSITRMATGGSYCADRALKCGGVAVHTRTMSQWTTAGGILVGCFQGVGVLFGG